MYFKQLYDVKVSLKNIFVSNQYLINKKRVINFGIISHHSAKLLEVILIAYL